MSVDANLDTREREDELPSEAEKLALTQSGPLLRFASESVKDLNPELPRTIAEALEAQSKHEWTPETSQRFWQAFNKLTMLISPVTIDGLTAVHKSIPRRSWITFWQEPELESMGERTSRRSTAALVVLLALTVPMQLVAWVYSNLSSEIERKSTALTDASSGLATKCAELSRTTRAPVGQSHNWTNEENAAIDSIHLSESAVLAQSKELSVSTQSLENWLLERYSPERTDQADRTARLAMETEDKDWFVACGGIIDSLRERTGFSLAVVAKARLLSAILIQFVLPILLGLIGALAYVLRMTSEEIRASTFSPTSPIRNLVRVALGGLMGAVIGLFTNLSNQVSLPPLALAFLAGYGVEGVFSMFDGFIERFRQTGTTGTGTK